MKKSLLYDYTKKRLAGVLSSSSTSPFFFIPSVRRHLLILKLITQGLNERAELERDKCIYQALVNLENFLSLAQSL